MVSRLDVKHYKTSAFYYHHAVANVSLVVPNNTSIRQLFSRDYNHHEPYSLSYTVNQTFSWLGATLT